MGEKRTRKREKAKERVMRAENTIITTMSSWICCYYYLWSSSSWRMLWDHALCTRNNDHMERKILHTPVLFFEYIEKPSDDCDVIGVWPHHTLDSDPSCPRLFHVSRACFNTGYSTLQSQRPCLPPSFNSHLPCPFCFAHLLPRLNFDC